MAEIYLARGTTAEGIERHVVLKRIRRERATDVEFVRMFLDEARLAAQLQHSNIAQVYDIGRLGDSFFFTMEYVHGETARALMQRSQSLREPLPIGCALTIAAGAAAGLHHAHERLGIDGRPLRIIHRDVSPSNLMVSFEGQVKVVDFGVAKADHRSHESRSGTVKGKINYLSPEQCHGRELDRRSDLFSLGIVLWEMLTLKQLFRRDTDWASMTAIVVDDAPPPSSQRPEVPPELDALVARLLAKSADDRFATADDVVQAIEALSAQIGTILSASTLGRIVRDLFGRRPEPWLEVGTLDDTPNAITVTSEPIPRTIETSTHDAIERELAVVPDLSGTTIRSPRHALPTAPPVVAPPFVAPRAAPLSAAPPPVAWTARLATRRVLASVVALGVVLGIVIAIVLARRTSQPAADRDAAAVALSPPPAPDAAAAAVVVEAPVEAAPPDAAPVETAPPDVEPIDAPPAVDAGVRVAADRRPTAPAAPTPAELRAQLAKGRAAEVVRACARLKIGRAIATTCAEAACKIGDARAVAWFAATPATTRERRPLVDACRASGIDLCVQDPMLCER